MKLAFVTLLAAAGFSLAAPLETEEARAILEGRQTASGCYHHASPTCCLPGVCMCQNGWIYQINRAQMEAGGHGCDPPWGFIATTRSGHPGYCCREGSSGDVETFDGEKVEASAFTSGHVAE